MFLFVNKRHGASCFGIFGTFVGGVVFVDAFGDIYGDPRVEGGVAALYYIDKVWHVTSNVTQALACTERTEVRVTGVWHVRLHRNTGFSPYREFFKPTEVRVTEIKYGMLEIL